MVENDLLHLLINLLLLPQNNIPFPLNSPVLELGVLADIRDDVDGLGHVLAEGLCVVHGLLAGGVGVEVGAEVLDFELKCVLGAAASALEGHVLEEVSSTGGLVGLCARASIDPHADGGGLCGGVGLGGDGEAVGEGGDLGEGGVGRCREPAQTRALAVTRGLVFGAGERGGRRGRTGYRDALLRARLSSIRETIVLAMTRVDFLELAVSRLAARKFTVDVTCGLCRRSRGRPQPIGGPEFRGLWTRVGPSPRPPSTEGGRNTAVDKMGSAFRP